MLPALAIAAKQLSCAGGRAFNAEPLLLSWSRDMTPIKLAKSRQRVIVSSVLGAWPHELDSVGCAIRFDAMRLLDGRNPHRMLGGNNSSAKWTYSKTAIDNNGLRGNLDHDCVLFVQHPSEKARSQALRSGSFIACAGVLGNCDGATEGGIPRSSRFRWFA